MTSARGSRAVVVDLKRAPQTRLAASSKRLLEACRRDDPPRRRLRAAQDVVELPSRQHSQRAGHLDTAAARTTQPTWVADCARAITSSSRPEARQRGVRVGIRPSPQTLSRRKRRLVGEHHVDADCKASTRAHGVPTGPAPTTGPRNAWAAERAEAGVGLIGAGGRQEAPTHSPRRRQPAGDASQALAEKRSELHLDQRHRIAHPAAPAAEHQPVPRCRPARPRSRPPGRDAVGSKPAAPAAAARCAPSG